MYTLCTVDKSEYIKWGASKSADQRLDSASADAASKQQLPVHVNCTPFEQQDVLVPWIMPRTDTPDSQMHLRYYHVFREGEFEQLIAEHCADVCTLEQCYYEQGNWCAVIRAV